MCWEKFKHWYLFTLSIVHVKHFLGHLNFGFTRQHSIGYTVSPSLKDTTWIKIFFNVKNFCFLMWITNIDQKVLLHWPQRQLRLFCMFSQRFDKVKDASYISKRKLIDRKVLFQFPSSFLCRIFKDSILPNFAFNVTEFYHSIFSSEIKSCGWYSQNFLR